MTNNEKLIAQARSGNHTATRPSLVLELADALEAAEKPHTPTDDALAVARNIVNQIGDLWSERIPSQDWVRVRQETNDRIDKFVVALIESLQHTPTDDEHTRIEQSNEVAGIVFDQVKKAWPDLHPVLDLRYGIADALWDAGLRRSEVPEPSEDRSHEFANMAAIMGVAKPQGEPSDAQVDAGCVAFYEHASGLTSWDRLVEYDAVLAERYRDGIRRALRAASAVTAEPNAARLLAQGFTEGVNFIDEQPGPWGAGMVAGRAEAARRRAAVTEQGENR